ncbi:PREDICTED: uncharacterized protein LOC105562599 [Vollenhovia emeryi]|uniref:uncharacterized protein LOC105562599 n=1 Tax=Vollenhovia emeryi TaxID=411798 RepID=UPI0005F4DB8F|nr:PREDICTED: uncharacterized protein LOC105562599 [Vollenhovia emeryi]
MAYSLRSKNKEMKTPLDLLESDPQAALGALGDLLRSYKYQSRSTLVEIENSLSRNRRPLTRYVKPPTYRIENEVQRKRLHDVNIAGPSNASKYRDRVIAGTKQQKHICPCISGTLVDFASVCKQFKVRNFVNVYIIFAHFFRLSTGDR